MSKVELDRPGGPLPLSVIDSTESPSSADADVPVLRRLAEADPAAYLPKLADLLSYLAVQLAEVGRREAALTVIEEAAGHYRRLAQANPASCPSWPCDRKNRSSL